MSRGDKRDRDRAKTQAKLAEKSGGKVGATTNKYNVQCTPPLMQYQPFMILLHTNHISSSTSCHFSISSLIQFNSIQFNSHQHQQSGNPLARNESDSAALAAKVAKKEAQKKEEEGSINNGANVKVVRKKGIRKDAGLDDLLNAGLKPGKK